MNTQFHVFLNAERRDTKEAFPIYYQRCDGFFFLDNPYYKDYRLNTKHSPQTLKLIYQL